VESAGPNSPRRVSAQSVLVSAQSAGRCKWVWTKRRDDRGPAASVSYRTDSAERLVHTDPGFCITFPGWSNAACNFFKWAALCCRGALPTVSPDEFRRERNQDDCSYDQQSQLHPKLAEQAAATACLTTLHVHLGGPPCDTAAQTADLSKGKQASARSTSFARHRPCAATQAALLGSVP
jgi:hypothetical protein